MSDARDGHRIALDGQPNFRDLGGYECADGRRTRRGLLFRSGELSRLSEADCQRIADLGLGTCVDLRSEAEIEERGADILAPETNWVHIPIDEANYLRDLISARFAAGDFSAPDADLMEEVNRSLVRNWMAEFGLLVLKISDCTSPLVFHCTHGKDRAGLGAALVLSVLGAPWETVEADYLLSNRYRAEENEAQLAQITAVADSASDPVDVTWMRGLFYVETRYLRAARDEIGRRFASPEDLVRTASGLDDHDIALLRERLLE